MTSCCGCGIQEGRTSFDDEVADADVDNWTGRGVDGLLNEWSLGVTTLNT
jgi:hypothetical protein